MIAQIDPWPLTLRELESAARRRMLYDWDIASGIRATIANCHSKTPLHPYQFNPMRDDKGNPYGV